MSLSSKLFYLLLWDAGLGHHKLHFSSTPRFPVRHAIREHRRETGKARGGNGTCSLLCSYVPPTLPLHGHFSLAATFGSSLQLSSALPESTSLCPRRGVRTGLKLPLPQRSEPSSWGTSTSWVMPFLRGLSPSFTGSSSDLLGSADPSLSLLSPQLKQWC